MINIAYAVRDNHRTPVNIFAECLILAGVSAGEAMSRVSITNISIGGCHVRAKPGYLSNDCDVAIRFGEQAMVCGRVCWTNELDFGVRFTEKLSPPILEEIVQSCQPWRTFRSVA